MAVIPGYCDPVLPPKLFLFVHLCAFQGGYLDGLRSHLGGLTQRVKSWYWGRPLVSANVFFVNR